MKLGFDIDGITANMAQALVDLMNEKYDLNHDVSVFKDHALYANKYVDDPELNDEIVDYIRAEIIESPDGAIDVEVHEDAVEAIKKLSRQHSIHHITNRPTIQQKSTTAWLRKNHIPFDTVHVIGRTGRDGAHSLGKGKLGRALNLDFYIDDCIWHLEDMHRYKHRWRKGLALFTQPWNADTVIDRGRFLRFEKWTEVIRHLGINKR